MDRFDDVSVVASVDESPPPPRIPRRARRAFAGVVATVVATGALAGAAVGVADEKAEPAPSAKKGWTSYAPLSDDRECERGKRFKQSQSSARY